MFKWIPSYNPQSVDFSNDDLIGAAVKTRLHDGQR